MKPDRSSKRYPWFPGSVALVVVLCAALPARAADPLPAYGADLSQTSISGLSSGAFMTTQFHIAHSATVVGAAVIAGGPFYCAGSYKSLQYLDAATTICMHPCGPGPDGKGLFAKAQEFAHSGRIDPVEGLADDRVYLFSGEADDTVTTFYQAAGVPAANIKYGKTVDAGHAIVTNNSGDSSCAVTKPPFINDCDFVQSHELLQHIYGRLKPPASRLSGGIVTVAGVRPYPLQPEGMLGLLGILEPGSIRAQLLFQASPADSGGHGHAGAPGTTTTLTTLLEPEKGHARDTLQTMARSQSDLARLVSRHE